MLGIQKTSSRPQGAPSDAQPSASPSSLPARAQSLGTSCLWERCWRLLAQLQGTESPGGKVRPCVARATRPGSIWGEKGDGGGTTMMTSVGTQHHASPGRFNCVTKHHQGQDTGT